VGDFLLGSIHLQLGYVCLRVCSCFPVAQRLDAVGRALCDFFSGARSDFHWRLRFIRWLKFDSCSVLGSVNRSSTEKVAPGVLSTGLGVVSSRSRFSSWLSSCDFLFKLL
jgi:hypothetical protein